MIIMWNVFLNSQDTILLAIQPAIQPASRIIQQIKSLMMIKFGTLIKITLFYPPFCFNQIHRHKHEIALSAHKHPLFCRGKTVMTAPAETQILLNHQHLYNFYIYIMIAKFQAIYIIVGEVTTNAKIFLVASSFLLG